MEKTIIKITTRDSNGNESVVEYRVDDALADKVKEFFEDLSKQKEDIKYRIRNSALIKKLKDGK